MEQAPSDPYFMEVMAHIGAQIGRVVERRRAEQALQKAHGTLTTGFSADELDVMKLAEDVESLARDLVDAMAAKKKDRRDARQR